MPAIISIAQILFTVVAVAAPIVLLSRLLQGEGPGSLSNMLAAPDFNAWPRGVQEEDPFRWGTTAAS